MGTHVAIERVLSSDNHPVQFDFVLVVERHRTAEKNVGYDAKSPIVDGARVRPTH